MFSGIGLPLYHREGIACVCNSDSGGYFPELNCLCIMGKVLSAYVTVILTAISRNWTASVS